MQLHHPAGKHAVRMEVTKYELLKVAIIECLKAQETATHTEIYQWILEEFEKSNIKFEGSVQWYMESVKLDLEAKNIILRIGKNPIRFQLSNA